MSSKYVVDEVQEIGNALFGLFLVLHLEDEILERSHFARLKSGHDACCFFGIELREHVFQCLPGMSQFGNC